MGFNVSLSWVLVLIACLIMAWCAYKTPAGVGRMTLVAWTLFFASIVFTGVLTMHTSGAH